ncbi:uncharacterized protein LOC109595429 isoform X2 [Aethina tumida]|uniref:uncharacterized protein LOC109595429 isoform X2 n=1 Tax=Aethina tumida TaxID=116153 RepID=UPI00214885C6|nr:uncharacterized protein LOC109595429 isoform X2 [Aethina tumida]
MKLYAGIILCCFVVIQNSDCLILKKVKEELSNSAQFVGCKFHNLREHFRHGSNYENCTRRRENPTESPATEKSVKTEIENAVKLVKCKLHNIKEEILRDHKENCTEEVSATSTEVNESKQLENLNVDLREYPQIDIRLGVPDSPSVDAQPKGTAESVTTQRPMTNQTFRMEGKRVISVKANCPSGQQDDGTGICREIF